MNWKRWRRKLDRSAPTFNRDTDNSLDTSTLFGTFCNLSRTVLDVGSGPCKAPYLQSIPLEDCVGLEPLRTQKKDLDIVRAVGEYIPFRTSSYNHSISGTSLDHCVNPTLTLKEMRRITKETGKIHLWVGLHDKQKLKFSKTSKNALKLLRSGERAEKTKITSPLARCTYLFHRGMLRVKAWLRSYTPNPYHTYQFTERTLRQTISKANLTILAERKTNDGSIFMTVQ